MEDDGNTFYPGLTLGTIVGFILGIFFSSLEVLMVGMIVGGLLGAIFDHYHPEGVKHYDKEHIPDKTEPSPVKPDETESHHD